MATMNWVRYYLSMDMDVGKNMARHSTGIDGFYSSPRSWILEQGASFVNSGIGTVIVWFLSRFQVIRVFKAASNSVSTLNNLAFMPNITKSGHEPIVSGIHIFASHRLSDKPRTATNSALLFGLSQSCKSIQIKTCGFLSIKLWPFHRDKYRETSSLKFMTDIVRHLKIGILHPSNSLPVTFCALFSGDKYRETRQLL